MIIEVGHFALILALCVAAVQSTVPLIGARYNRIAWMQLATRAAVLQCAALAVAFGSLIHAYIVSDFSVTNVAENSHTDKPLLYKVTGVWGNHEGSMLLWVMVLSLYGLALARSGRDIPLALRARALAVQGMISTGFLTFILFTSNPFLRLAPLPLNGQGLNPILQDPGLAFHPPCLYLGYVGFSMAFSFALAALIEGRVDAAWARWVRPWSLASWCFLTVGITLGSWWAYYTLGWGGFWYWDPVENASFIPWLSGTALLHSLAVVEKRGTLKAWTILLAIVTFALALIGTFLVRSGVLTSVHSFAADPERGVFILLLLTLLIGGAFVLFLWRAPILKGGGFFAPLSREGALLLNNMLLATASGSILLGTLYPLFIDALGLGKISVGPPFFNRVFTPLMVPLVVAMGIGPSLPWKRGDWAPLKARLITILLLVLVTLVGLWLIEGGSARSLAVSTGFSLALWLLLTTLAEACARIGLFSRPLPQALSRALHLPRATLGMFLAHAAMAFVIAGVTGALAFRSESLVTMRPGDSVHLGDFDVRLQNVAENQKGPNYTATRATFVASRNGVYVASLEPEHRLFDAPPEPATATAIHTDLLEDLYAVIGAPDGKGGYLTRLYVTPLIPWVFLGSILMALGGAIALTDRRYKIGAASRKARLLDAPLPALKGSEMRAPRPALYLMPLLAFLLLAAFFFARLSLIRDGQGPERLPSALLGQQAPAFDLPALERGHGNLKSEDLKGHWTLLNFFATWCVPCQAEHPLLNSLKENKAIRLLGINYEDEPGKAIAWLKKMGDPYAEVASDRDGRTALDFGVYGVPETYLIDQNGIIRWRATGPLTPQIVREELLPQLGNPAP